MMNQKNLSNVKNESDLTGMKAQIKNSGEVGTFLRFGLNTTGEGSFTSAIIMMPDGQIKNVYSEEVRFLEDHQSNEDEQ